MARCVKSERLGRPMFYGAMITEGIVALIWATVSMYFFYGGAAQELGASLSLQAPEVVTTVSQGWLGTFGGILALLGVVAAPITSGDTALRSARLIIAEFLHLDQKSYMKRIYICIPLFGATLALLFFNIENPDGFNVIWSYFGWANQTLAVFTLWAITVYLVRQKKPWIITMLPALFMTVVCSSFIMISPNAFGFDMTVGYAVGGAALIVSPRRAKEQTYNLLIIKIRNAMKKIAMFIIALAMSITANAQFEQGKVYIGASLTGVDLSYSGSEKFHLGVEATGGYFIMDNIMLKASAGVNYSGKDDAPTDFTLGLGGRYYILQNGLFLGANAKLIHSNHNYNDIMPEVEVGYAFFLSRTVTIEPSIYYDQSFRKHSDYSKFGARVGIGVYLFKD